MVLYNRCTKSVQMRSFFCSVFSRIWTEYGDLLFKSYLDTFHAVNDRCYAEIFKICTSQVPMYLKKPEMDHLSKILISSVRNLIVVASRFKNNGFQREMNVRFL